MKTAVRNVRNYLFMRNKIFVEDHFKGNKRSLWDNKRVVESASLSVGVWNLNVGKLLRPNV